MGITDKFGEQIDMRRVNSWTTRLDEIETPEILEVFSVNSITPFLLNSRLKHMLIKSPHVINLIKFP